ncbi:J domain-containing protein [Candidatus Gracilibacteria bacterium]|nr:J domain-containing protein [Candidatus Gracilibacteria bacterium]
MSKKIPNDYIEKIIIDIKNIDIKNNDKILLDPELGYVKNIISGIINENNTRKTLIRSNIGYRLKKDALVREISILSEKLQKSINSNSLLDIKTGLNSIVLKYKELIDYITLHGDEKDKMIIKDLSDKLNGYIIEEEKYDLLYKKFAEFIIEFSKIELEYNKFLNGFGLNAEPLVSLISKVKSIILKSSNFLKYLNINEVKKLNDMLLNLEQILSILNSRSKGSTNSKNKKTTNLSFEEALDIFGLKKEELNIDSLKKSYRRQASKLHPDKNIGKDTNEEMSRLNQARDLLERYLE